MLATCDYTISAMIIENFRHLLYPRLFLSPQLFYSHIPNIGQNALPQLIAYNFLTYSAKATKLNSCKYLGTPINRENLARTAHKICLYQAIIFPRLQFFLIFGSLTHIPAPTVRLRCQISRYLVQCIAHAVRVQRNLSPWIKAMPVVCRPASNNN